MASKKWIILGVIVVVLSGIFLYTNKQAGPAPTVSPEPVSIEVTTPVMPIDPGKQIYNVLTDEPSDFQITRIDLDPLNVQMNKEQTITVYVEDKENRPITKLTGVKGIIHTDTGETKVDFVLRKAGDPDSITQWQGTWTLQDTINQRYMATISAFASFGESSVDMPFR